MMKVFPLYRRKDTFSGLHLQAVQVSAENYRFVAGWCGGNEVMEHDAVDPSFIIFGINVPVSGGTKRASEGAWVMQGANKEFYVIDSEKFEREYEEVDD